MDIIGNLLGQTNIKIKSGTIAGKKSQNVYLVGAGGGTYPVRSISGAYNIGEKIILLHTDAAIYIIGSESGGAATRKEITING